MSKPIITQEQADAIEHKRKYDGRGIQVILRDVFYEPNETTSIKSVNEIIREIGMEDFLKALYIGYEVEPKFKVRDWVYDKNADVFLQIDDKDMATRYSEFPSIYRHATPEEIAKEKQRIWWSEHGRDVDHYKENDVIKESYNQVVREVSHVEDNIVYMKCGGGFGKDALKIVCFAEDRKDA